MLQVENSASDVPIVPKEFGGKWIAWDYDGTHIVASGATLAEVAEAARCGRLSFAPLREGATVQRKGHREETVKFPYRRYAVDPTPALPDDELFRPVIPVRMRANASLDLYALVDTGADESYITDEMAKSLGVIPLSDDLFTIDSASGSMEVLYGEVAIEVEQGMDRHEWSAIVGIVPQMWSEAILGHAGFLYYFSAYFSDDARVLELHRNSVATPELQQ